MHQTPSLCPVIVFTLYYLEASHIFIDLSCDPVANSLGFLGFALMQSTEFSCSNEWKKIKNLCYARLIAMIRMYINYIIDLFIWYLPLITAMGLTSLKLCTALWTKSIGSDGSV